MLPFFHLRHHHACYAHSMKRYLHTIRTCTKGATAIEYGVIVALIAVVLIAGAMALGGGLGSNTSSTSNKIINATE